MEKRERRGGGESLTTEEKIIKSLYSEDSEQSLIGCMMAYPAEVIEEVVNYPIKEKDFFVPANQIVFRVICEMYEEGISIEIMTVHQRLSDMMDGGMTMAERVQSPGILAGYAASYGTHYSWSTYARTIWEKGILRAVHDAANGINQRILSNPGDVHAVLAEAESEMEAISDSAATSGEVNFGLEIEEAALSIFEHAESGGGLRGLPTGFKKMDELTMGWVKGDLVIVAARPGKGKTGLMMKFIKTIVENQFNVETGQADIPGQPVQVFSMEMRRHELYMRLYAMVAGVGLSDILSGDITQTAKDKILKAQAAMSSWPIFIDDTSRMDIALVRARARRAVRKHKAVAIFVDYLQLARSRKYPKDRQNEVADISGTLKQIAMENDVPVIALAQLNRVDADKEDVEPHISNIRDSGAIEQDADKIILLHEDKNADRITKTSDSLKHYRAILAKHRNGRQGRVEMDFEAWRVYFTEYIRI